MNSTDVRVKSVESRTDEYRYRTPIKFGGVALDRVTLLNAHVTVRTEAGVTARGFGSMPLGNVWSFPSRTLGYNDTLGAMKSLADHLRSLYADCREESVKALVLGDQRAQFGEFFGGGHRGSRN